MSSHSPFAAERMENTACASQFCRMKSGSVIVTHVNDKERSRVQQKQLSDEKLSNVNCETMDAKRNKRNRNYKSIFFILCSRELT